MHTNTCTFLLLLLSLALPVLSDLCPDHDKLPSTCKCEENFVYEDVDMKLSCSGATLDELNNTLSLLDTYSMLDVQLNHMKLKSLPSRFFDGWNVVRLEITFCELDSLAEQGKVFLAGLEDTLDSLVITYSFKEGNQLTKIDLSHLRRLTDLDLSYNVITEVSDEWFARGPTSLTGLVLTNNGIKKIGDRAFANLVNLNQLWLDGNRFGPIKRSMFPRPANRLDKLQIDNNALTSIPDDLFTHMPALRDLSISNNEILHLPRKAFKPIWSRLYILDARCNPLECDSTMEWLFHARTKATVLGTCEGPLGRNGTDLEEFIRNRGL